MKINRNDLPTIIDVPGAKARQLKDFGEATGYGKMAAEWFSLGEGTDLAPLLAGLPDDGCQAPHWGYVMEGSLTVTYTGGETESAEAGEMFYWPPGHTVRADSNAEILLFSPQHEHCAALDHAKAKMGL